MTHITVACLDMAGTTVRDDGSVLESGVRHAQCEAADASEKLDAIHRGTF